MLLDLLDNINMCIDVVVRIFMILTNFSDGIPCDDGHSSTQNSTGGVTHNTICNIAKTAKISKNNTKFKAVLGLFSSTFRLQAAVEGLFSRLMFIISAKRLTIIILTQKQQKV